MKFGTKNSFLLTLLLGVFVLICAILLTPGYASIFFGGTTAKSPELQQFMDQYPTLSLLMGKVLDVNKDFTIDSFEKGKVDEIEVKNEWIFTGEINEASMEWVYSPDKKRALSTYLYWGEPDSSLELHNSNSGQKLKTLAFCGTPCSFWGVVWLDNNRFVFIWDYFDFSDPEKSGRDVFDLGIDIYDLEKGVIYPYILKGLKEPAKKPIWEDWDRREKRMYENLRGS